MQKKRVAVVGAGPGGLTAAMMLAHQGFEVMVFEKEDEVGGRNAGLRLGPYAFDVGPTFLMMTFILEEVFRLTQRRMSDYLEYQKLDPMYQLHFDDFTVNCSSDHETMQRELEEKFSASGDVVRNFLSGEKKRFEKLMPALRRDYSSFSSLFSKELRRALAYFGMRQSLFDVLGNYFEQEKLKLSYTFQAKYLGMSPWECPGGFAIIPYIEHNFGIWHVMGGLFKICEAMAKVVKEEGGEIYTGTPVKSLLTEGKTVTGVALENGEEVKADYVVVNADFAYTMSNLVEEGKLKKYAPAKLKDKGYSCSIFMMYLGVDKLYSHLDHHQIYFASDYRTNVEDIFQRYSVSEDFSMYIQNASATDPYVAPSGHSALYVLVPVPNNKSNIDWEQRKPLMRQQVLDKMKARAGLDDIEERIVEEKIISPLEWEQDYNVYLGATFNLAHSINQMLYFRPHNKFQELDRLYLVGGGTHPGSGLPTIYQSGLISSALIAQDSGKDVKSPLLWQPAQEKTFAS